MSSINTKQNRLDAIAKAGGDKARRAFDWTGRAVIKVLDAKAREWRIMTVAARNDVVIVNGMQAVDHRLDVVSERREPVGDRRGDLVQRSLDRANTALFMGC
jgi:hypothetical protein